jgi:choline dehydrogenase-like flavoprotein
MPKLRVHGIAGLRVAGASIMPTLTSGNTKTLSIMIGEKAADIVNAATCPSLDANDRFRRVSPVAPHPSEAPLTGRTAGTQPSQRELLFMAPF